jgi:hypothetical protein
VGLGRFLTNFKNRKLQRKQRVFGKTFLTPNKKQQNNLDFAK